MEVVAPLSISPPLPLLHSPLSLTTSSWSRGDRMHSAPLLPATGLLLQLRSRQSGRLEYVAMYDAACRRGVWTAQNRSHLARYLCSGRSTERRNALDVIRSTRLVDFGCFRQLAPFATSVRSAFIMPPRRRVSHRWQDSCFFGRQEHVAVQERILSFCDSRDIASLSLAGVQSV